MDIAAFISELLEHQEKLAIPGLGTFYRSRVEGYYNKDQQQFYPPSLQLQFNAELHDDDGLLIEAMTADRQINSASARYFLEKYVFNILNLATTEDVPIGDLGTFSMRRNQLIFAPKKLNNNNELFYGLAPVRLRRNRMQQTDTGLPKPALQMPVTEKPSAFTAALLRGEPMPGKALTAVDEPEQELVNDEEKKPARISTWVLVVALIILLSGIGLICAYKYNPALFDRFRSQNEPPPISDKKRARNVSDSIQNSIEAQKNIGAIPSVDSSALKKILPPEAPRDTFGLVINKFAALAGANKEYDRYRYASLPVEIHKSPTDVDNPYQVTVATYLNIDSAKKHLDEYKKKLRLPTIFIQTYPYKKQ
jgi:hypothetical protein